MIGCNVVVADTEDGLGNFSPHLQQQFTRMVRGTRR